MARSDYALQRRGSATTYIGVLVPDVDLTSRQHGRSRLFTDPGYVSSLQQLRECMESVTQQKVNKHG